MSGGKILVVDDEPRNIKLLSAQLIAADYSVITAGNGQEALQQAEQHQPDVILLDIMMPGLDGYEVTRRLKANKKTEYIPVVLVTALEGTDNRVKGLDAGADEFLSKPVNRSELLARVRALYRMKIMQDELRHRSAIKNDFASEVKGEIRDQDVVLLIEDDKSIAQQFGMILEQSGHIVSYAGSYEEALQHIGQFLPDLVILDILLPDHNGLDLLDELKSREDARDIPVLVVTSYRDLDIKIDSLDRGADDFLVKPIDIVELNARVRACLRRSKANKSLRQDVTRLVNDNITDRLTGVRNRHYLDADLQHRYAMTIRNPERIFCVVMVDIDHFKSINDQLGHLAGDAVLRRIGILLEKSARETDIVCRYGGEEFCVILPECSLDNAITVAQRMCDAIAHYKFEDISDRNITASFGVAMITNDVKDVNILLARADQAMYRAKESGRNRVCCYESPTTAQA